ncbi:MAG: trans-aconitate 2-methyltransferase [Bradyrhizobium sp.]|nr:MAG: trans-aconitate 2-methyltransferase [Bradyrhizobium sp.]
MTVGPRGAASGWNPALYLKFEQERTRAARDLLAGVPALAARRVVDLGCGPGNSAALLAERFPEAELTGVDFSEPMLAEARRRAPSARFVNQDIANWSPDAPADLVFANAALHFLPAHHELLPRLFATLGVGGCLAVQMPITLHEASHTAMRLVAADGPWATRLAPIVRAQPVVAEFETYYEWLSEAGAAVEVWTTTYVHALDGVDGVVDWFAGSGLRPFLDPLDEAEREAFLARYREAIAQSYAPRHDGKILLPYPRLFIVARQR